MQLSPEQFSLQFRQLLERTGEVMLQSFAEAHSLGLDDDYAQKMVFETTRDMIAQNASCSLLEAASLVRLALHFAVKKRGKGTGQYSRAELEIILARLGYGNQETNGQSN